VSWLLFPVVLATISLGIALLIEIGSEARLPGALLLPIGFAGLIVAADICTLSGTTARLMVPTVMLIAAGGFVGAFRTGRLQALRLDRWLAGTAIAVFVAYGAPVLFSGIATFAGYASLDDTSEFFSLIDRVMSHGRNSAGLPPSVYHQLLHRFLSQGYPLGTMMPLGVGAHLVGTDVAWVIQPYFAFQGLLLSLIVSVLLRPALGGRRLGTLAVFVASQPALLYGYELWGAIKEVVVAPLLALVVLMAARALRTPPSVRGFLPLVVVTAAVLSALSLGGAVWLAPALLPLVSLARRLPLHDALQRAAFAAGMLVLISLPTLATARAFRASTSTFHVVSFHALSVLEVLGLWPVADFRDRPSPMWPTYVLIALLVSLAAAGVLGAVRARLWAVPLYVATACVGCLIVSVGGTPWVTAKAFAMASPAFLVAAFTGLRALRLRSSERIATLTAVVLAGGVLASNVLAYSGARLAPRNQLAELETIGKLFDGQGPSAMNEFQPYAIRHFLRGLGIAQFNPDDIDTYPLTTVMHYRTLVLDHVALGSRPPSPYRLVREGRFYDVWQRDDSAPAVLERLPLGQGLQPTDVPKCSDIRTLAAIAAKAHGRVAAVPRPVPLGFEFGVAQHPPSWRIDHSKGVYPSSDGTISAHIKFARAATYDVWLGGFTAGKLEVTVDGRKVGTATHRIELPIQYILLGSIALGAGMHDVELHYTRPLLQPGSRSYIADLPMGPIAFATSTEASPVQYRSPAQASSFCGQQLDWAEAVAGT